MLPRSDRSSTHPLTEPVSQLDTVTLPFEESLPPLFGATEQGPAEVISTLSGALQDDVGRFLQTPDPTDLLPVLAASIRHSRPLVMHLASASGEGAVLLVTLPRMQAYACNVDLYGLADRQVRELRLQRVDEGTHASVDLAGCRRGMLSDLVWRLALHGSRQHLLPEITGPLAYRTVGQPERESPAIPGVHGILKLLSGPPISLTELRRQKLDAELAKRVLNALYLRSALIVTRACATRPRNYSSLWR